MTHRQFLRLLQSDVEKAPTRWRAAERLGISESMLSRVLRGKQSPSDALLQHYGLKREVVYSKMKAESRPKIALLQP